MRVTSFETPGRHGYNVKFSPLLPDILACASSENYGITGKGELFILQTLDSGLQVNTKFDWPDGLFDVTWSELDQNILATCSGDRTLQIWDILRPEMAAVVLFGHTEEIYGVDWSPRNADQLLLSASWDHTVKLWDPISGVELNTFYGHNNMVYSAVWSPHMPGTFASASGDTTVKLWDIRTPQLPSDIITAHSTDVLTCDWCKLNPNILATGGTDNLIRGWDIRNTDTPAFQLVGHEYAVRRIKFSPFQESILASVSYDFSTRLWEWSNPESLQSHSLHTEFVYGLDFSKHIQGKMCDCGWDSIVQVYDELEV